MEIRIAALGIIVALAALIVTVATAEASCSCSRQPSGIYRCVCVDQQGRHYCLSCSSSSTNSCALELLMGRCTRPLARVGNRPARWSFPS
jgi:hypothetical protein